MKNQIEIEKESVILYPLSFMPVLAALLFFSILVISCEDVIEVNLSEENLNLIGVEASITTQSKPTVFLYNTLKADQDQAFPELAEHLLSYQTMLLHPTPSRLPKIRRKKECMWCLRTPAILVFPDGNTP